MIPIDYNKMQKELDRRRYMGQVYTGKYETWQATELGIKTYGKWCDLVGWENLTEQKWKSSDDFMNLAIKRKWGEVVYDFNTKTNVVKQTKFGHDLFKTFEYWIDEKAQKRAVRKKQINGVMSGFQKALQGLPKFMQQISAMMASFAPRKYCNSAPYERDLSYPYDIMSSSSQNLIKISRLGKNTQPFKFY